MLRLPVLLISLMGCSIVSAQPPKNSAARPSSQWVYTGKNGKLNYKTTEKGDRIMDFSHAGYMGGGVALPEVPVKITVQPSGKTDDTETIQAAINAVAAMPLVNQFRGAVLLAPGAFTCSTTITISASGIVLKGSGSGTGGTTIRITGGKHTAIVIGGRNNQRGGAAPTTGEASPAATLSSTTINDSYVPSGAISFKVADATGFSKGDLIEIRKPVTAAWIAFMKMDDLVRNEKPQTWIAEGSKLVTLRTITAVQGSTITLDVPLSDCIDAGYTKPAGTIVTQVKPAGITQAAVEHLHIQAPPMETSHEQALYAALRINGRDCWARDLLIEETMNSVGVNGSRITLERVAVTRTVPNVGASKPAEFAPNASQVLMDRCSSVGDNIWHAGTGAGVAGPIVMLNCLFKGNGHVEGHQRWTTGMLLDNCQIPDGGIDFKNRGSMGSGHGWGVGWAVAWNCKAKEFVIQQPPGSYNWMIGCIGPNKPIPRPFGQSPDLPLGISDSPDQPVAVKSLYLSQLKERLGMQALRNIGYGEADLAY